METEMLEGCPVCNSDDVEVDEDNNNLAFCNDCGYEGPAVQFGGE